MTGHARPSPIRTDGKNAFTDLSMQVRVPKILSDVLDHNRDYAASIASAVLRLRDDIRANAKLPPVALPAPDACEWEPAVASRQGESWLSTEWFFAEWYVYRCLMAAVRYWETGRDPFAPIKREELAAKGIDEALERALSLGASGPGERLHGLLGLALWGNRVDLSYRAGVAFGAAGSKDDLLCDDREWTVARLLEPPSSGASGVHIVADNTGSELSMDLALIDAVIAVTGARVTLHVKMHPAFVSDATTHDVFALLAAIEARGGELRGLAARLRRAFDDGRLRVVPDFFWNGPYFLWDCPSRLAAELDRAALVIFKGDANYRRVIGDAIYPGDARFSDATSFFRAPRVCLRTMKSDPLVGITAERAASLDATDVDWRINGRRGVIQGAAAYIGPRDRE
ncbi:MAG TPA: damage-control phosphatase ARMT1 family protein [Polyangiaceae bacterium]|nr:damage-control phosphatase ARMT1 family protein [Polyangiaceae bacterium]